VVKHVQAFMDIGY